LVECRFCSAPIGWEQKGKHWIPTNPDGSFHRCRKLYSPEFDLQPNDAYCAKCLLPILKGANTCNHMNPLWIHRRELPRLRELRRKAERAQEKEQRVEVEKKYKCLRCDGNALRIGASVVCLSDVEHVFPAEIYD
jgi:hypothetical protein